MGFVGELRANTAVDVLIGPFVDDTDGKTAETGLTIDVELSKNGQALANKTDVTAPTHDAAGDIDGYYNCELDTTDTNTEGMLTLVCFASGALPVRHDFAILAEAAWDSKYIAKDDGFMDVNVKTIGRADTQETEANNLESACANYSATRGLTGTAVPAAAADAAGGLPISDAGGLDLDTKLAATNEVTAARMATLTDWINGGRLDLILDIIAADTTTDIPALIDALPTAAEVKTAIEAAGSHLALILEDTGTTLPAAIDAVDNFVDTEVTALTTELAKVPKSDSTVTWNATALASIQSECNDALVAYDPPTKAELDTAVANVSVDEIQATAVADLFNTDSLTTYAAAVAGSVVKEIADNAGGSALTAESIADAVWNELSTGHTDAGKAGTQLWTDVDAILVDTGTTLQGELDAIEAAVITNAAGVDIAADIIALKAETAAILVDTGTTLQAELDGIQADTEDLQTQIGTDGAGLTAVPWNAAWDAEVQSEAQDAITASALATAANLATVDTVVDAVKVVTDALTAAGATKLATSAGTIVAGTVAATASSTTIIYSDDITEATADHYNGRIIIFTSGVLTNQATDITDYELATGEGKFTVTAMTEAPAENNTFIIV